MDEIKLSVIITAFNMEKCIGRAIKSVCSQKYNNIEIIIIDDGSQDNTGTIIDQYAQTDQRIIAIHQTNIGLVASRNKGIHIAAGKYIGFVDGDDYIEPDMYQRLMDNAEKFNADISHCGMVFCKPDGTKEMHYGTNELRLHNNFEGQKELLLGQTIEPSLCNKVTKKELLIDSCLDETIMNNEDLLRCFVLFQRADRSVFEDFCGYCYIQHDGSMSRNQEALEQIAKDKLKARELIVQHSTTDIHPYAMRSWISCAINCIHEIDLMDREAVDSMRKTLRAFLIQHRKDIRYLIPRQKAAAWLIIIFPSLEMRLHQLYKKVL